MKSISSVSIDTELFIEIKRRHLKISPIFQEFLRIYLQMPEEKKETNLEEEALKNKITIKKAEVALLEQQQHKMLTKAEKQYQADIKSGKIIHFD